MKSPDYVRAKVRQLESKFTERDARWAAVTAVRSGRLYEVFPDHFNDAFPFPMVANVIDNVARDLSEALAPLPALNCQSGTLATDQARKFASRRTRIGASYWSDSNLQMRMPMAADNYVTYGMAPFIVEPDRTGQKPKIRYLGVHGALPEYDLDGEVVSFTRRFNARIGDLAAQYPEASARLMRNDVGQRVSADKEVVVFRYVDADQYLVFVDSPYVVLSQVRNRLGRCPVVVALRPSPDDQVRGQFDDVLGVHAARAIMMALAVEGAQKAVQAPIAVPDDVDEIAVGADAIMRTSQPQNVRRVELNVDGSTFQEMGALQQELLNGARYPGARQGALQGSVITGRGVEALMGGFDSQIKTGQLIFADTLQKLTSLAFHMDEAYFGRAEKTIRGTVEGTPFEESYIPVKHIKGDYTCDVTYGFLSGMDPNRSLVFLLQLLGAKAIDRSTLQRHMPFDVDVNQLQQNIDAEELRDALKQGVMAWTQAIGPMVQQGQDPGDVLKVVASAIRGRQTGKALEDLLVDGLEALEKEKQDAAAAAAAAQAGQGGGMPPGMDASGLMQGVAPGQAGQAPGGKPDLQMLLAKLGSSGQPQMSAGVSRAIPV